MDFKKYTNKKWFIELKKNRTQFNNIDNLIESAKAKYEIALIWLYREKDKKYKSKK